MARRTLSSRWSSLSATMKGVASFGLCFVALVLVSWIFRACCATESEAVSIVSIERPEDASWVTMPVAVGTVLVTDGNWHNLPGTWMPCEGQTLRAEDHPDLAVALGSTTDESPPRQFKLPDYRGLSVLKRSGNTGVVRWLGSGRRTYGNLRLSGAALTPPIPDITMSELRFIIRVT